MWTDYDELPTTGQVARQLGKELDIGLTEGQIAGIKRRRADISPVIWRGLARWRDEDVAALRDYLVTRGWAGREAQELSA
jgi:hypothetical protein